MNAGGVPNACKSSGLALGLVSGGRVSNAWVICRVVGDNSGKPGLIPHMHGDVQSSNTPREEPASHQLVGGVRAHLGYDG